MKRGTFIHDEPAGVGLDTQEEWAGIVEFFCQLHIVHHANRLDHLELHQGILHRDASANVQTTARALADILDRLHDLDGREGSVTVQKPPTGGHPDLKP